MRVKRGWELLVKVQVQDSFDCIRCVDEDVIRITLTTRHPKRSDEIGDLGNVDHFPDKFRSFAVPSIGKWFIGPNIFGAAVSLHQFSGLAKRLFVQHNRNIPVGSIRHPQKTSEEGPNPACWDEVLYGNNEVDVFGCLCHASNVPPAAHGGEKLFLCSKTEP